MQGQRVELQHSFEHILLPLLYLSKYRNISNEDFYFYIAVGGCVQKFYYQILKKPMECPSSSAILEYE